MCVHTCEAGTRAQQILTDRVIFKQTPQPQNKELRAGFEAALASEKRRWKKRLLEERQVADEALEAAQVGPWVGPCGMRGRVVVVVGLGADVRSLFHPTLL